jgi:hypothetical protein
MAKSHKTRRKSQKRRVMRGGYTPIVYTDEQKEQLREDDKTDEEIERFENAGIEFDDLIEAIRQLKKEEGKLTVEELVSTEDNNTDNNGTTLNGGRKRRTMKRRKSQKSRATRKQRGGDVFYSDKQRKHLIELGILQKNLKKWQEAKFPYAKAVNYLNDDHADNYTDRQKRQLERKGWSIEHIEKHDGQMPFELLINENPKGHNHAKNSNSSTDIEEERFSDVPFNSNRTTTGRSSSNKKTRKTKSSQRGGTCYGNGVGANSYDPNFSIYNTRQLELFPYSAK